MSIPRKLCPRCQASLPLDAPACLRAGCGHTFSSAFTPTLPAGGAYDPTLATPRARRTLPWPALFAAGCALMLLPCIVGIPLSLIRAAQAPAPPPDLTPLVVPGQGSINTPGGPVDPNGGTRSVTVLWSLQSGNAAWGRVKNTGTEPLKGVTVWRPGYERSEVQGFSVGKPAREFVTWEHGANRDLSPGKSAGFWLRGVYSVPITLTVEDADGKEIDASQEIEPLKGP